MDADVRVLHWSTNPFQRDGQTLYPLRLAERMRGVSVDFMTWRVDDASLVERAARIGAEVLVVPDRLNRPLSYMRDAQRILMKRRYDAVHVHGSSHTMVLELLAARRAGITARIAHSHNSSGASPLMHTALMPVFDRLYTQGFACSDEAGKWMFGNRGYELAPNAVDLDAYAFDPDARLRVRRSLELDDAFVIGMVGSRVPAKNHDFMLRVFAEARKRRPALRLLLIGAGTEALGGEGVLGLGSRSDMAGSYAAMDALALPSLHEGFPTVVPEGASCGLTVLLSDRITRACALTGRITRLPLDQDVWVEALTDLAPVDRRAAGDEARKALAAGGYDLDRAAAQMAEYYRKISR